MKATRTNLPGVLILEPDVFADNRGVFFETYHVRKFAELGITAPFVQDNHSVSMLGAVRGLHYQIGQGQAKLVRAVVGEIWDIAVDIRRGSPAFGRWTGVSLSAENRRQLYVPAGFAHGFCALSATVEVLYKCSAVYAPELERGILWSDPELGIDWRLPAEAVLSARDAANPRLRDVAEADLPGR